MEKSNTIQFAEKRLSDPNNSNYEKMYWAAYLDGALAQAKEDSND